MSRDASRCELHEASLAVLDGRPSASTPLIVTGEVSHTHGRAEFRRLEPGNG